MTPFGMGGRWEDELEDYMVRADVAEQRLHEQARSQQETQAKMSTERRALERLLAMFPDRDVEWIGPPNLVAHVVSTVVITPMDDPGPWLIVRFLGGTTQDSEYCIWRETGETFMLDEHGAIIDEPSSFLPPVTP